MEGVASLLSKLENFIIRAAENSRGQILSVQHLRSLLRDELESRHRDVWQAIETTAAILDMEPERIIDTLIYQIRENLWNHGSIELTTSNTRDMVPLYPLLVEKPAPPLVYLWKRAKT
jgi:hypothetical protein